MTIVLKIVVTIIAIIFSLPIPYMIFKGLMREEVKRDAIKLEVNNKIIDIAMIIWFFCVHVVVPIMISIMVFQGKEKWHDYLIPIAYAISWQFVFAGIAMRKRMLPFVLPILVIVFVFCTNIPIRNLLASIF